MRVNELISKKSHFCRTRKNNNITSSSRQSRVIIIIIIIIIRGRRRHHVERVAVGVHGKHAAAEFGRFDEERSGGACRRGGVVAFPRRRHSARRWERRPLWGEDVRETERSCVVGKSIVVVVYYSYSYESSGRDGRVPRVERERAR